MSSLDTGVFSMVFIDTRAVVKSRLGCKIFGFLTAGTARNWYSYIGTTFTLRHLGGGLPTATTPLAGGVCHGLIMACIGRQAVTFVFM